VHGSDAPAELGRDLRRDDRRIDGIGQGALESPRGPLPRHATRRGAARSAAPRSASSTCWPSPSAYPHDHITPLACDIPGTTPPQPGHHGHLLEISVMPPEPRSFPDGAKSARLRPAPLPDDRTRR